MSTVKLEEATTGGVIEDYGDEMLNHYIMLRKQHVWLATGKIPKCAGEKGTEIVMDFVDPSLPERFQIRRAVNAARW